jgi:hypothetical protein
VWMTGRGRRRKTERDGAERSQGGSRSALHHCGAAGRRGVEPLADGHGPEELHLI